MGRYIVSFIGKEAAIAAKASALSLESLGTCSSSQVERVFNFCLTKEAYFSIRGSLDSNSALTCPTTSRESLRIESLSAPMASASSRPTIKASYFDSLLEALKPKRTACSILSPVEEVNCRPMQLLTVWKPHQRKGSTCPSCPGKYRAAGFLRGSKLRLAPSLKFLACTRCNTRSIPLPKGPSFRNDRVYELCPIVVDQLAPQRGELRSMGRAFGRPSGGLKQLVRGGYIWSPHRSRTC